MFSTSNDILLLTIAACVAAFTIFSCWGLFYIVAAIRNIFKVTAEFKNILKKVEETVDVLKNKIHESTTYLLLFGEVLKKVMDVAKGFGERRREAREEREAEEKCGCEEENISNIKKSQPRKIKVK